MAEQSASTGPLEGVRVLDVGNLIAGPLVATLLGDLGADVIKVEHPVHGDPLRMFGRIVDGHSLYWKSAGRNKRCITLDLSKPGGQRTLKKLVGVSDILTENFRAGTLERWGLGWDDLKEHNPDLIMVRTSGFGQSGPYSDRPGFGTIAESMSGFAFMTGEPDGPPQLPQMPLADGIAAITGAFGAAAALNRVRNGGGGQWIDNTLYEPLMRIMELINLEYAQTGTVRTRTGSRMGDVVPRGAYESSEPERWVALSGSTPATAKRIFTAIGRTDLLDDPRLQTNEDRIRNRDIIDDALSEWIGQHTQAEVLATFREADAPIGAIYNAADILADEHVRARETFVDVDDPDLSSMKLQGVMPRLSESPGSIRHTGRAKGADNDDVFRGLLDLDDDDLAELADEGAIE